MRLNNEQSKHLSGSLRAYGLGQMAAFGFVGIQINHWPTMVISTLIMLFFEFVAILILKDTARNI